LDLQGKTYFITGSSRGIGREIALKLAGFGANIVVAAKSDTPHPTLEGTIFSVADEVSAAGGKALPIKLDIRDEDAVEAAMKQAANHFGGVDALVNNASAISVTTTDATSYKQYDLMHDINVRGTFVCTKAALPYLQKSGRAHILTMAPPVNLNPKWLGPSAAYTTSKYAMSILTLSFAAEFAGSKIYANTLWPATTIDTAAVRVHFNDFVAHSRKPSIVADAAHHIMCVMDPAPTGQNFIDEVVLRQAGVSNFDHYAVDPSKPLTGDFFLD
jgi:citronellol/citronellal dehydrogenase